MREKDLADGLDIGAHLLRCIGPRLPCQRVGCYRIDDSEKKKDHQHSANDFRIEKPQAGPELFLQVQKHEDKEDQHHDGAGVNDNLDNGDELLVKQKVEDGYAEKVSTRKRALWMGFFRVISSKEAMIEVKAAPRKTTH